MSDSIHTAHSAGTIVGVCISEQRGTRKRNVGQAELIAGYGLGDDAHGGNWHRQVSLLAQESINKARQKWGLDVGPGDFAENLTISGINLRIVPVGSLLKIGDKVLLEVTQHGKKCHQGCEIQQQTGKCIFPLEGVFAKVLKGGLVQVGDPITLQQIQPDSSDKLHI